MVKSIMDLDIFEVYHKVVEVCQRVPRITLQRDDSQIDEVSPSDEGDRQSAMCDILGVEVACFPHKTLNQCKGIIFFSKPDEVFRGETVRGT